MAGDHGQHRREVAGTGPGAISEGRGGRTPLVAGSSNVIKAISTGEGQQSFGHAAGRSGRAMVQLSGCAR